ncbi:MAG: hypothetical protein WDM88_10775 [Galbitalea sp.]
MTKPMNAHSRGRKAGSLAAVVLLLGVAIAGGAFAEAAYADGSSGNSPVTVTIPTATPTPTPTPSDTFTPPPNDNENENFNGTGSGSGSSDDTSSSGAATEPPLPTTPGTGEKAIITDAKAIYAVGDNLTVGAGGFTPGEQVQVVIFSKASRIGNFTADGTGKISATFVLPKNLKAGTHTVEFMGWQSKKIAVVTFLVEAAPAHQGLGATALSIAVWWLVGGVILLALLGFAVWFAIRSFRGNSGGEPVEA